MKKFPHALTMAFIALTSPLAFAASSTDLSVTGTITPRACEPKLSDGGNVHHGKISSKDLNKDKITNLALKTLQLTVNCDSAIAFRLKPIDNRLGSATGSHFLGLGFVNGDQRLGSVDAGFYSSLADGVAVLPIYSRNNGDTWFSNRWLEHNAHFAFGAVADPSTPIAIKDLVTDLQVLTQIARADSLDLANDVALDGSVTLEVLYP